MLSNLYGDNSAQVAVLYLVGTMLRSPVLTSLHSSLKLSLVTAQLFKAKAVPLGTTRCIYYLLRTYSFRDETHLYISGRRLTSQHKMCVLSRQVEILP